MARHAAPLDMPKYNRRAIELHDVVNLALIPVVALGTILGILGKVDPVIVSQGFLLYVLIDFIWLVIQPEAVPSLPNVILAHHVVTVVLLYFPLRYNELGIYTCIDGLCEINTFFLIARRQWPKLRGAMDWMYWITFIPSRTICYPIMLYEFWHVFEERVERGLASRWEQYTCCGCQASLILFNAALLYLGLRKKFSGKDA